MAYPVTLDAPIVYPGPPPQAADVVVIGGGVIGVCTALFLARAGQKVVLCEKGRIAGEQSSRNWGWIRAQGRDAAELPIMLEAQAHWQALAGETNRDIGLVQGGITYLSDDPARIAGFEDWLPQARATGLETRVLGRAEVAALYPGLAKGFAGALYTPSDMRAEPGLAVPALAGIAARAGAILVEQCAVRILDIEAGAVAGVVTEAGRIAAPRVVVAGGAWSALFLRNAGVTIPQLSVRESVLATGPMPEIGAPQGSNGRVAFRRRLDGGFTLAPPGVYDLYIGPDAFRGFRHYIEQLKPDPFGPNYKLWAPRGFPDGWTTARRWDGDGPSPFEAMRVLEPEPDYAALRGIVTEFEALFPGAGPVQVKRRWAGMIDTMPDIVPVVDRAESIPGLIIGTGMSGHGFGIGPGMGRVLADLAMDRAPGHDLTRFRLSRFTDGSKMVPGPAI